MKLYEIYKLDIFKGNKKLTNNLNNLIEKYYSHLRHYLRPDIEVDAFLIDKIFDIVIEDVMNE